MNIWQKVLIKPDTRIREALSIINEARSQFVMVIDLDRVLRGTVSDGDIRRALLAGASLDTRVCEIMCKNPTVASESESDENVLALMRRGALHQIPIVDHARRVTGLRTVDDFLKIEPHDNPVVIMAGGLGRRLNELTRERPKPMLPVGGKPLLETIVSRFVDQGFTKIWIAVNYKSEFIENHFGDGRNFGACIRYLKESKRLGTAGALSLLPRELSGPVLVSNADLVIDINYRRLLETHLSLRSLATMAVREHEYQIPFGVVVANAGRIQRIEEKPVHRVMVNTGVYILSREAIARIPLDTFFDMPQLFEDLIASDCVVGYHQITGYWLDIGRLTDYELANTVFGMLNQGRGQ